MTWWQAVLVAILIILSGIAGSFMTLMKLKIETLALEKRQRILEEEVGALHKQAIHAMAKYEALEDTIDELERDGVVIHPTTGQRILNRRGRQR